ncbi:MAG: ParB/RepB/Spo0J family partition protein [Bacilli bacterium]|nr:ParB/RepB/Spo0J family partition protein [Bacilli bacterium]
MKNAKKKILSSSLADLVSKFSQQNIVAEIEKRYQSAPAKLLPISSIVDCSYIRDVKLPEETMEYFASRLKEKGFYNPLVVRPKEDGTYEVILGRKRYFGAMKAGIYSLPCAFAEVEDEEMLLMLLADTRDQREANVVEMALVCRALHDLFGYNQHTLAELSHQSRCQISNIMRILKLPTELQEAICLGKLSYGHGRALATLNYEEADKLGHRILEESLSVRQTEDIVKEIRGENQREPYSVEETGNTLVITFESKEELDAFRKSKRI